MKILLFVVSDVAAAGAGAGGEAAGLEKKEEEKKEESEGKSDDDMGLGGCGIVMSTDTLTSSVECVYPIKQFLYIQFY